MRRFESVSCPAPCNAQQINEYYGAFSIALQEIKIYSLVDRYGEKSIAQRFYNGLPALLKHFMALYDSLHEHTPDFRDDYHALQKEVRNVKQWRLITDALAQLSKAKALSAATPPKRTPPPLSNARRGSSDPRLILAAGNTMQLLPVATIRKQKHGFRAMLLILTLNTKKCARALSSSLGANLMPSHAIL